MVDLWIERFQEKMYETFSKTEDTVAGAAGAIFMPFVKPVEPFAPVGDTGDSDEEQQRNKTGAFPVMFLHGVPIAMPFSVIAEPFMTAGGCKNHENEILHLQVNNAVRTSKL